MRSNPETMQLTGLAMVRVNPGGRRVLRRRAPSIHELGARHRATGTFGAVGATPEATVFAANGVRSSLPAPKAGQRAGEPAGFAKVGASSRLLQLPAPIRWKVTWSSVSLRATIVAPLDLSAALALVEY